MLLEVRAIGRKTPADGRLDVTPATYRRLSIISAPLQGKVGEAVAPMALERKTCQRCSTHGDAGGDHHFLASEVFRLLQPGEHCVIELAEDGRTIEVARPHPLSP